MSKCKNCETKVNAFLGRGDGLCKECGVKADELAKNDAEQKELRRKQQVLKESNDNLDFIVNSLSDEQPLCYTFINCGVQEKKKGGVGWLIGGMMGGVMGAMIGNTLNPGSCNYSGELGLLLVNKSKIILGHLIVPFESADANISSDHLKLLRAKLDDKTLDIKEFNICQVQFLISDAAGSTSSLVNGNEVRTFKKSNLYINDTLHELPSLLQVHNTLSELGALVTPQNFIALLINGECSISEDRYQQIKCDEKYFNDVFKMIVTHDRHDEMVQHFDCLSPSLRDLLDGRIMSMASSYRGTVISVVIWSAILIFSIWGITHPDTSNMFLSIVGAIIGVIFLLISVTKMNRAKWCKRLLKC